MRIGIPRGLLFLEYMDFIVRFFEELDCQVVISDKTNKQILDDGIEVSVDDICLPVKLFHGHVLNLIGRVDYIFIPRITSLYPGEHICPKFGGLPELIKYSIKDLPPIIETELDFYNNYEEIKESVYRIGYHITADKYQIKTAYNTALNTLFETKQRMMQGCLPIDGILKDPVKAMGELRLMVLGHSYNLYDSYSNMNLFEKLNKKGVKYVTPEVLDKSILDHHAKISGKRQYWTFSKKLLGLVNFGIEHNKMDGIIYISSFACGLDSVIVEDIQRIARRNDIPFLLLTIDEHTGEAGINTRLEAFIDMLERMNGYEGNISAYGEHLYNLKSNA